MGQTRFWDFLSSVPYTKFTSWLKNIVPSGLYTTTSFTLIENNLTVSTPIKYVLPSGKVVEETEKITFLLPSINLGSPATFSLTAYGKLGTSTRSAEIQYLFINGYHTTQSANQLHDTDLGLEAGEYEFLVLANLIFDGSVWSVFPVTTSILDATSSTQRLVAPFSYQLIVNTGSDFDYILNETYGPSYQQTTGSYKMHLGVPGLIEKLTFSVVGSNLQVGSIRVTLLPTSYAFVQTFNLVPGLQNIVVEPTIGTTSPTLANSTLELTLIDNVTLLGITIQHS